MGQKHSRLSALVDARIAADAEFEKESKRLRALADRENEGEEISRSERRSRERLVRSPPDLPAAELFAKFESFADAVREWRVQRAPARRAELTEFERSESERIEQEAPHRKKAADAILHALKPLPDSDDDSPNYVAATTAILQWHESAAKSTDEARLRVATQLVGEVYPLLWAYRDPAIFFEEIAPKYWPDDFSFHKGEPTGFFDFGTRRHVLANALLTWGPGVLRNRTLRGGFVRASSDELSWILGYAGVKQRYVDGPSVGATKGKRKTGRPRTPMASTRPGTIERQLYRDGVRKSIKK